jgi:nucleoside-diphosphate-sugar epimerase
MQKVAITGSNGFIGGHLKMRLEKLGYAVIPIHREMRQRPSEIILFMEREKPDYIFDIAGYGNHYFQTEEAEIYKANVQGLFTLLENTKNYSYKGFINFSTTSHNLEASTFYGSTKSAGEYLVRSFVNIHNKPIINIRPYSVFGEREWEFRFIPTICEQIKRGEPITVSNVEHDWIYIEDFLDGIIEAMNHTEDLRGASIGIGSGKRIKNMEIVNRLMAIAQRKVEINEGIKRSYEIANYKKIIEGEKRQDEIHYFQFAKTSLEQALWNIYTNPNFLKRENI